MCYTCMISAVTYLLRHVDLWYGRLLDHGCYDHGAIACELIIGVFVIV
jgi:hypothetical protein